MRTRDPSRVTLHPPTAPYARSGAVQNSSDERLLQEAKASSSDHRERRLHTIQTGLREAGVQERFCGLEAAQVGVESKRKVYMRMRGVGKDARDRAGGS